MHKRGVDEGLACCGNLGTMPPVGAASSRELRRRGLRRLLAFVAATALLVRTGTALAGPATTDLAAARALFAQAEEDERAGRWADALEKLRRASTVKMTPGLRFHIALCEEKTGHLVAALEDYSAAQAAARLADNREVLGLVGEPLLALKVRVPTLTITLPAAFTGRDARAEVRLDGAVVSAASIGVPVPVDVGSHTIQAVAPGQAPYTATVTVVERQGSSVEVRFVPLAAFAQPAVATVGGARSSVATPAEHPEPHRSRTLAIAATAGAVVLVAGGVGAFAAAGSDQSYWQGQCQGKGPGCGNPTPVRAWDAVALGAWVAGAGAGVLAVVLWSAPDGAGRTAVGGGPGSLWLRQTF